MLSNGAAAPVSFHFSVSLRYPFPFPVSLALCYFARATHRFVSFPLLPLLECGVKLIFPGHVFCLDAGQFRSGESGCVELSWRHRHRMRGTLTRHPGAAITTLSHSLLRTSHGLDYLPNGCPLNAFPPTPPRSMDTRRTFACRSLTASTRRV